MDSFLRMREATGMEREELGLAAEHMLSVWDPASDGSCVVSTVGLYGTEPVVATAGGGARLHLHRPFCRAHEASWQTPHSGRIVQLCFSAVPPLQLASASLDCLLLWQLENTLPLPPGEAPPCLVTELPLFSGLVCVRFSPSARHLAVCDDTVVLVWGAESHQLETTLQAHRSPITSATFHPHHSHTLITTSQDRTFKVWDIEEGCVVYQSPVLSSLPLTCAAVDGDKDILAITAADGRLWQLDMSAGGGYRCLLQCDVWRERDRFLLTHSLTTEEGGGQAEAGTTPLGLHYWGGPPPSGDGCNSVVSESLLQEREGLMVVGHSAVVTLDPNTLQVTHYVDFRDPIPSSVYPPFSVLPVAGSCDMITSPCDNQVYCILNGLFEMAVSLLLFGKTPNMKNPRIRTSDHPLSILSSAPLVPNSPLRSEFKMKPHPPSSVTTAKHPRVEMKKKVGGGRATVSDKPLTFKTKVRSSGYTATPRMKMFAPCTTITSSKQPPKQTSVPKSKEQIERVYPMDRGVPTALHCTLQPLDTPSPLSPLTFSGDGRYVSCGAADKAVYLMRIPPSQKKIQVLVGHNGNVQSVDWSHSGEWVLSGSADRTARLWTLAQKDPLLVISHIQSSSKLKSNLKNTAGEPQFPAAITHSVFYYLDKFLLLSSSNSLYLYKYHIDPHPTDDIKRYQNQNGYKLVQSLPAHDMQTITALSSTNDFLSHLVVVGGSNRSVDVFDMNTAQRVRSMVECHTRPPHCVALNKGSRGASHPSWAYDLFLTAAPTDGIKLWDLRTNRCVRCLSAHVNRCHSLQAHFSPCSRYIATGSEDRAAYMYDLRFLSPLHKLSGHSDVVTSLSFHPLRPMMATATLDGNVSFFTPET